jgi:hypothetical protein
VNFDVFLVAIQGHEPQGFDRAIKDADAIIFMANRDLDNPAARQTNHFRYTQLRTRLANPHAIPWIFVFNGPATDEVDPWEWSERLQVPPPHAKPEREASASGPREVMFVAQPDGSGVTASLKAAVFHALAQFKRTGMMPRDATE